VPKGSPKKTFRLASEGLSSITTPEQSNSPIKINDTMSGLRAPLPCVAQSKQSPLFAPRRPPLTEKKLSSPPFQSPLDALVISKNSGARPPIASSSGACAGLEPLPPLQSHSPSQFAAMAARQKAHIQSLQAEATAREQMLQALRTRDQERETVCAMMREEMEALRFVIAVQEQKVTELEDSAALARIDKNEALSHRSKKYKAALSKVSKERSEYEARANAVIQQMNEQMASLQTLAMERIETLEHDLIESRHANEKLRAQIGVLQKALAEARRAYAVQGMLLPTSPGSEQAHSRRSTVSPAHQQRRPASSSSEAAAEMVFEDFALAGEACEQQNQNQDQNQQLEPLAAAEDMAET
jgi:hypothetical protein